jgi:hypothetical protein
MKPLAAKQHGVVDYLAGIILVTSPWLFQFNYLSDNATYTMVLVGSIVLLASLMTNYPLGIIKALPFPIHGFIELIGAGMLLVSPWLMGFVNVTPAFNTAIVMGIAYLAVVFITNYSAYQASHPYHPVHHHRHSH